MGVAGIRLILHQCEHGAAQRLGAADLGMRLEFGDRGGGELDGGTRLHRPVRDKHPAGTRIKNARAKPDSASAPGLSPAAVLQADRITQSALSLRVATSLAIKRPSSASVGSSGTVSASAGSANPLMSPATRPWVAKAMTRYSASRPLLLNDLTAVSLALAPRMSSFAGAPRLAAIPFNSSAVSYKGARWRNALTSPSAPRKYSDTPRTVSLLATLRSFPPRLVGSVGAFWKTGLPKPMNGFPVWVPFAKARNARRLAIDGSTVMAWRLISQAASLSR